MNPLDTEVGHHQLRGRLQVSSNDMEQKTQIGKVVGRVQENEKRKRRMTGTYPKCMGP